MSTCITQIAKELYEELAEPSDISISSIAYWLRSNLGKLNNRLCASFDMDCDLNVTPDLNLGAADIFKTMYAIYYFNKNANSNLGAMVFNSVLEIDSDGSRIKMNNKNEIAKTYINLRNLANEDLKNLINGYKFCRAGAAITNVAGIDGSCFDCCTWRATCSNMRRCVSN